MLTPADIRDIATGFQRSRVLLTGIELKVWTALGDERLSSAVVASRLGCDPRATDRLLNALVAIGLLGKAKGLFANTEVSRRYLVETSPEFLGGLGHSASMWHAWSGMTDAVRKGAPAIREAINDRGDGWLDAVHRRHAPPGRAAGAGCRLDARPRTAWRGSSTWAAAPARSRWPSRGTSPGWRRWSSICRTSCRSPAGTSTRPACRRASPRPRATI